MQKFNQAVTNPLNVFRTAFPAWKNYWESNSEGLAAMEHGIIAGTISPISAATTEKLFNIIPRIEEDNIRGNGLKTLKTAITPLVASTLCFGAVALAKTSGGVAALTAVSTGIAGALSAAAPILAGSAVIAGGAIAITYLTHIAYMPNDGHKTNVNKEPNSLRSALTKATGKLNDNLQATAKNGIDHYRVIFPANLTFLGASIAGGFSTPAAVAIGMVGGVAAMKTAKFVQGRLNARNNNGGVNRNGLGGVFDKVKVPMTTALCASTAAIAIPATIKPIINMIA